MKENNTPLNQPWYTFQFSWCSLSVLNCVVNVWFTSIFLIEKCPQIVNQVFLAQVVAVQAVN